MVRVRVLLALACALVGVLVAPALALPASPGTGYDGDFPDPHVLRVGDTWYAYATNTGGRHLPVLRSTDLRTWTHVLTDAPVLGDALPGPAAWAQGRDGGLARETWAPGVAAVAGRFLAYYAVRVPAAVDRFCISVATGATPVGPFVDASTGPLVCDEDPHGSIDPYPFVDPATGRAYLLWKAEGLPGRAPQRLLSRELSADGLGFAPGSAARELLRAEQPWEDGVVENPALVAHGGSLVLFWSGGRWDSAGYATGAATCRSPLGPCGRTSPGPVLASAGDRLGRGGASPFVDGSGRLRLAHHYWQAPRTSYRAGGTRRLGVATVTVQGGRVRVDG